MPLRSRVIWFFAVSVLLLLILILLAIDFPVALRPRKVYKSARSPDGSWQVTVFRQATNFYPITDGVYVIVKVEDTNGKLLYEQIIDNRDRWYDVEHRYPEVICDDDQIRIGPKYWNGEKFTYFVLRRDMGMGSRLDIGHFRLTTGRRLTAEQLRRTPAAYPGRWWEKETRMHPLFDKDCELVGWIDPMNHIFDTDMNWVAYVSGGHA